MVGTSSLSCRIGSLHRLRLICCTTCRRIPFWKHCSRYNVFGYMYRSEGAPWRRVCRIIALYICSLRRRETCDVRRRWFNRYFFCRASGSKDITTDFIRESSSRQVVFQVLTSCGGKVIGSQLQSNACVQSKEINVASLFLFSPSETLLCNLATWWSRDSPMQ